jgi:hypothetical protein
MITEHEKFIVLKCSECGRKTIEGQLYRLSHDYTNVAKAMGWKVVSEEVQYCWTCYHKNSYEDILTRLREEMDLNE